jgi:glycine cleavage system aminomethyltransferase T/glycine/D-amino acid oxidase-like deaminating enzyme
MPADDIGEHLPERARVVVIGAGIVGCSAAYFLTRFGWNDVTVLDHGPLFQVLGSTSHAPGLVFQTNPSRTVCHLAKTSVELYRQLEVDDGPCFYPVGSIEVACSSARDRELKRRFGFATSWGLPARLITPQEARELVPILDQNRILCAYHVPSDGIAKAVRVLRALVREGQNAGARFLANTGVTAIETKHGRVKAVVTNRGRIEAENVLLCAGIWGPRIGRMAGVPVPMLPVQHLYARTAPIRELAGESCEVRHPIVRNQDRAMYFRQHWDSYGIGSYRHEPLPLDMEDIAAADGTPNGPALRAFPTEHFTAGHNAAIELFPSLRGVDLADRVNGIFAFTPDGQSLVGESMYLDGFWIAEAVWVTHAGGVGRAIAKYMVEGTPDIDLHEIDCNRFHSHTFSRTCVWTRGAQQYREVYDVIHPLQQIAEPRPLRTSPFYARQQELGAVFFESAGWERPQWFTVNESLPGSDDGPPRDSWTGRFWSQAVAAEHRTARERVALFDLTPFTKLQVAGPGALHFLQELAANQMDQPDGKITYTALLNEHGGIECDLTVTRMAEDRFLMVTGALAGMHDLAWVRRHMPCDGSVQLTNLTSNYCAIGVWGPLARDLIQSVSESDVSNSAFPYMTAQEIYIGHAPALALRISYVGELGWEVYVPVEYGRYTWDTLWAAGQSIGVIAAGGGAFESMRLEKGYRLWGADIHSEHNPFETGLAFAVRLNKGDFRGRAVLDRVRKKDVRRRLCCLTLDDPCAIVMGKEPILDGDCALGWVTSASYGYTIRRGIAYGYLPVELSAQGTKLDILYFGRRYQATVSAEPLFDPENKRLTN